GDDPEADRVQYSTIFLDDESGTGAKSVPIEGDAAISFSGGFPGGFTYSDKLTEEKMGVAPLPAGPSATLPDTTIILNEAYTIEESDLEKVREIIKKDGEYDIHRGCVGLLTEVLSQEREYSDFTETIAVVEKIQTEFVRSGRLDVAGEILAMLSQLRQDIPKSRTNLKERIQNALVMAGGWEKLSYLSDALNADSSISPQSVEAYLDHFGWEALSTIVDLLGTLEYRQHREAICDYLVGVGKSRVNIIAKGIYDRRWFVVRNTASVLARIGGEEAVPHLEKAMMHEDSRVRFQVARGLSKYQSEKNINLLIKLLWDPNELVRDTAFQSLLKFSGETGLNVIVATVNDDRFASLSESQQQTLIMLLSELGGEHAVNYLVSLISSGGLFRSQINEFYQRVAFSALAHNRSEKAKKALLRLTKSWRSKLRRMAKDALRQRREFMYSGE
ncbi:MAG: HEAT repeat domain-containing protein, partial [Candidatus Zixiibacteriota bacterium]